MVDDYGLLAVFGPTRILEGTLRIISIFPPVKKEIRQWFFAGIDNRDFGIILAVNGKRNQKTAQHRSASAHLILFSLEPVSYRHRQKHRDMNPAANRFSGREAGIFGRHAAIGIGPPSPRLEA